MGSGYDAVCGECGGQKSLPVQTEECQHLLPKFLCRTCSATFWEKAMGITGPLTVQERKDAKTYYEHIAKVTRPALIEAEASLNDVKKKIERYISNKL